jgi:hypothetical protein
MKKLITETNFNKWFKNGGGIVWQILGITSTIGGSIFFFDLLGINKKVKNIFFKNDDFTKYDPEVIEKATEYYKEQYEKGVFIDYKDALDKLQELKDNSKKINKKDD